MSHIALYRAWRPQSFQDMVGQKHIIQTLQNSLREQRFTHAYLFSGPRGTGKTSTAKILAKAVNCERGPAEEPCNECGACVRITAGSVMDVIEIDAASNRGVDEIRDLREKVKYAPTEVRQKVYIIDEVHMLTTEAFNALLKTLEEPPAHVIFILATTEPHRLPATIISRCQRFDFRRVSLEEQVEHLRRICEREGVRGDDDALQYIARLSDGGMRDAISLLDQIVSFTGEHITYRHVLDITGGMAAEQFAGLAAAIRSGDVGAVLQTIEQLMQDGKSPDKCMENLIYYFRDLLMIKMVPNAEALTDRLVDPSRFRETADAFEQDRLFQMIDILNRYQTEMKYAAAPQTLFEVALLKICTLQNVPSAPAAAAAASSAPAESAVVKQLEQKVASLEAKIEQLLKTGVQAGQAASSGSAGSSRGAAKPSASAGRASIAAKFPPQFEMYLSRKDDADFTHIRTQWSRVLQRVKEEKVTVHAWFVDGEPVSAVDDAVLVAFKNTIHRDTTERAANKQLIEQVLAEVFGKPLKLVTMLLKDWAASLSDREEAGGELQWEAGEASADGDGGAARESGRQPWIDEAIQMFGEDLVVVKKDE
ncbi:MULTISPECIES: DNA polymerase III subunit gamma/tau [unclassified Paenibacillus]|uniref:DNA polymerase III subunit gamma/tau n=1 Tax=unclassified Paenibacillus TaxID=185978 RepID=UPI001C11EA90|nr:MULTISPECIES: DNA polymerase III subunit gamma/tau [unclassified Paenibacillus]MBU5444486.1 DNA polymerase III subunit gamma/tau [Paenibacillus sp. MSJ-34]CAH0122726.1 DNA polymerase III subunit gamma/tau [Paenibacillus sp. CECT 9249]